MVLPWLKTGVAFIVRRLSASLGRELARSRAQRRAVEGEATSTTDGIAGALDDTINILMGRSETPSWWNGVVASVRQRQIAAPQEFQNPSIQNWLDDEKVRAELRGLIANKIATPGDHSLEEVSYGVLFEKYQSLAGERGTNASGKIDLIVAVTHARLKSDMSSSPATSALSVQLQATTEKLMNARTAPSVPQDPHRTSVIRTADPIPIAQLTKVAESLLHAGRPPSVALLFPEASSKARAALETATERRRTISRERGPAEGRITTTVDALIKSAEVKHLIIGEPGCGKTYTLWRTAKRILDAGDVIPMYLPATRLSTWTDLVQIITAAEPDISASSLFTDPRVCICIDGWSEFATGENMHERQKTLNALHGTRVIATAKFADAGDAAFDIWKLDLLPPDTVTEVVTKAHPGEPLPARSVLELLRLPLLLSLSVLTEMRASAIGDLVPTFVGA